jgi:hypothetical protein
MSAEVNIKIIQGVYDAFGRRRFSPAGPPPALLAGRPAAGVPSGRRPPPVIMGLP